MGAVPGERELMAVRMQPLAQTDDGRLNQQSGIARRGRPLLGTGHRAGGGDFGSISHAFAEAGEAR